MDMLFTKALAKAISVISFILLTTSVLLAVIILSYPDIMIQVISYSAAGLCLAIALALLISFIRAAIAPCSRERREDGDNTYRR